MQLLYGSMVTPNRELFTRSEIGEGRRLSKYVNDLYEFQVKALNASQLHLAEVMDQRVSNNNSNDREFTDGSYVLVYREDLVLDKLSAPYSGPYLVVNHSGNTYNCKDLTDDQVHAFDVSILREFMYTPETDLLAIASTDSNSFKVKCIRDHRNTGTGTSKKLYEFLVEFVSGIKQWLPYMEVRQLVALDAYVDVNDSPNLEMFRNKR